MSQQGPKESVGERRTSTRFPIQAPAVATLGNKKIWAFTRDISERAIYLRTAAEEERPQIGEVLDFVIKIPPSMHFWKPCSIRGRGRTIRLDESAAHESGLVVEVLEYKIETESVYEN